MEISEKVLQRHADQRHDPAGQNRLKLAYTISELVSDTGAGRSKIYEEIGAGRLKTRKLGKRTLVLHDDATSWLQSLPAS